MGGRRRPEDHTEREEMEYDASEQNPTDNTNARKRLVSSDGTVKICGQSIPNLAGRVAGTVLQLENGPDGVTRDATAASASTPDKAPVVKRRKQGHRRVAPVEELGAAAAREVGARVFEIEATGAQGLCAGELRWLEVADSEPRGGDRAQRGAPWPSMVRRRKLL